MGQFLKSYPENWLQIVKSKQQFIKKRSYVRLAGVSWDPRPCLSPPAAPGCGSDGPRRRPSPPPPWRRGCPRRAGSRWPSSRPCPGRRDNPQRFGGNGRRRPPSPLSREERLMKSCVFSLYVLTSHPARPRVVPNKYRTSDSALLNTIFLLAFKKETRMKTVNFCDIYFLNPGKCDRRSHDSQFIFNYNRRVKESLGPPALMWFHCRWNYCIPKMAHQTIMVELVNSFPWFVQKIIHFL